MREIDKDIYLHIFYVYLGLTKQFFESNPIDTYVSLKMMKPNGDFYRKNISNGKFKDYGFVNYAKFISLKDIMNPSNSLYNEQTDSVTIEAQIKIKNLNYFLNKI